MPDSLYDRLKVKLKKVAISNVTYYVAEGDTLLDDDQLRLYADQREAADRLRSADDRATHAGFGLTRIAGSMRTGLLGITRNGSIVRWHPNQVLSYRVIRNTFPSEVAYQQVVDAIRSATEEWEQTCGVKFEHRAQLDGNPGIDPAGALFAVRYFDAQGAFIAAAFFPTDPPDRRRVLIDPSFFADNLGFERIGVLRHELGHVLGFRHEHIRSGAPPLCPGEERNETIELTKYDPQSVMHYFCGGVGSPELRITELDRTGSQMLYGPPLNQVQFVGD